MEAILLRFRVVDHSSGFLNPTYSEPLSGVLELGFCNCEVLFEIQSNQIHYSILTDCEE